MKILLDNHNESISNIVNICCERVGAQIEAYTQESNDYDLIIKDFKSGDEISQFDFKKTLFLINKDEIDNFIGKHYLQKPFLPIDLIEFLSNFGSSDNEISDEFREKNAKDILVISDLVKEIDEIDNISNKVGSMETNRENFEDLVEKFYESQDERPLISVAHEFEELEKNIDTDLDDIEIPDDEPLNLVADDFNLDNIDDDIPLDQIADDEPLDLLGANSDEKSLDVSIDDLQKPLDEVVDFADKTDTIKIDEAEEPLFDDIIQLNDDLNQIGESIDNSKSNFEAEFSKILDEIDDNSLIGIDEKPNQNDDFVDDSTIPVAKNENLELENFEIEPAKENFELKEDDLDDIEISTPINLTATEEIEESSEKTPDFSDLSPVNIADLGDSDFLASKENEILSTDTEENDDDVENFSQNDTQNDDKIAELEGKIKKDLQDSINETLASYSHDEDTKSVLKDLKININISFEDK